MYPFFKIFIFVCLSFTVLKGWANQVENPISKLSDSWQYSLAISAWTPAAWVTNSDQGFSKSMYSSISNNISSAQTASFLTAEARKGEWGLMADLVYVKMMNSSSETKNIPSIQKPPVSIYVGTNLKTVQSMTTVAGIYSLQRSDELAIDGLVGIRNIGVTSSINANLRLTAANQRISVNSNPSITSQSNNGVIGIKGRARIYGTSWFMPFYGDIGRAPGGDVNTWQAQFGIGNRYQWGDVILTYRAMYFSTQTSGIVSKTLNAGPQLSAVFNI